MYGIMPTYFITHINGHATPDLPTFVKVVRALPDNEYVRVKSVSFDLYPSVMTLKTCNHYYPVMELVRDRKSENGWKKVEYMSE